MTIDTSELLPLMFYINKIPTSSQKGLMISFTVMLQPFMKYHSLLPPCFLSCIITKKSSLKYFTGCNDDNVVRPLCIKLPQMVGYVKHFDSDKKKCLLRLVITNC